MRAKRIELIFNGSYEISNVLDFAAIFPALNSLVQMQIPQILNLEMLLIESTNPD